MIIAESEFRKIYLPLVRPFRSSFGTQNGRENLMVKVTTPEGIIGWVNALHCRFRSTPQYVAGCLEMMKIFFAPALNRVAEFRAEEVAFILKPFLGAQMAKAALETAILDAQLRGAGISLAKYLNATKS